VTKTRSPFLGDGWRNRIDEAYTGNRPAHREVRTLLKCCIGQPRKSKMLRVQTLTSVENRTGIRELVSGCRPQPGSEDRGMVEEKRRR